MLLFAAAFAQDLTAADLKRARQLKGRAEAAWVYGGAAESKPPPGKQYVGADLSLKRFDGRIELSDIEAFDPGSKAAYGNPQFACIAEDGGRLDCSTAGEHARVRLVFTVSEAARTLKFTLYGRRLAGKVAIDPSGPALPPRR